MSKRKYTNQQVINMGLSLVENGVAYWSKSNTIKKLVIRYIGIKQFYKLTNTKPSRKSRPEVARNNFKTPYSATLSYILNKAQTVGKTDYETIGRVFDFIRDGGADGILNRFQAERL